MNQAQSYIEFVAAIATFGTSMASIFAAWHAWRSANISSQNRASIKEIHILINSRLDQLIAASTGMARAEGAADQIAKQGLIDAAKLESGASGVGPALLALACYIALTEFSTIIF